MLPNLHNMFFSRRTEPEQIQPVKQLLLRCSEVAHFVFPERRLDDLRLHVIGLVLLGLTTLVAGLLLLRYLFLRAESRLSCTKKDN